MRRVIPFKLIFNVIFSPVDDHNKVNHAEGRQEIANQYHDI